MRRELHFASWSFKLELNNQKSVNMLTKCRSIFAHFSLLRFPGEADSPATSIDIPKRREMRVSTEQQRPTGCLFFSSRDFPRKRIRRLPYFQRRHIRCEFRYGATTIDRPFVFTRRNLPRKQILRRPIVQNTGSGANLLTGRRQSIGTVRFSVSICRGSESPPTTWFDLKASRAASEFGRSDGGSFDGDDRS